MAANVIPYGPALKKAEFNDFVFLPISSAGIDDIINDQQTIHKPSEVALRNTILAALSENSGKKVAKVLLFFSPKEPTFDKLGFLYMEDKTIQAIKLEGNTQLQAWEDYICNQEFMGKTELRDWLLIYSESEIRRKGLSHVYKSDI